NGSITVFSFSPDCRLSSRERAKLCFKATRCKPHEGADDVKEFTFSDLNLGNERIVSSSTPCGDFFFRCHQSSEFHQPARSSSSSRGQAPPPSDITSIAKKCNELDLHLIVIWKAYVVEDNKQRMVEGQLHVALQAVGQEASSLLPREEAQEMMLLRFRSESPPPALLPHPQLSQLIRTNLGYPETFSHHFLRDR
ncbi:PREDICTED: trafficking protein particle complex subunit 8-like, partial [Cyprinodon variegatus]|uniref:trafficking protein particle complex subunit 8-like n=1 Tax=Cyprinodon variegatus TaxID=28743 RepID=UPI000742AEBA